MSVVRRAQGPGDVHVVAPRRDRREEHIGHRVRGWNRTYVARAGRAAGSRQTHARVLQVPRRRRRGRRRG